MPKRKLTKEEKKALKPFKWKFIDESNNEYLTIYGYKKKKLPQWLVIPDCVEKLAQSSFYDLGSKNADPGSVTLVLGRNLKIIGAGAFDMCSPLGYIDFKRAEKLEIIGRDAFRHTNLEKANFDAAKNLKRIEDGAFKYNSLKRANLPLSLEYLGDTFIGAHYYDYRVQIYIPQTCQISGKLIERKEFYEGVKKGTGNIHIYGLDRSKDILPTLVYSPKSHIGSLITPTVGTSAPVRRVEKGPNVLPKHAPHFPDQYRKLYKYSETPNLPGYYYIHGFTDLFRDSKISTLIIPDCITTFSGTTRTYINGMVEVPANRNLPYVNKVVLSSNLLILGEKAFIDCSHIKDINIGDLVHLEAIENYAFRNTGISSVTIPSRVKKIGALAFYGCNNLTKVTIASNSDLMTIGKYAFSNCPYLKVIDFSNAALLDTIEDYAFGDEIEDIYSYSRVNSSLKEIILPPNFDAVKHHVPKNIFGSGISYVQSGNRLIPSKEDQAKATEKRNKELDNLQKENEALHEKAKKEAAFLEVKHAQEYQRRLQAANSGDSEAQYQLALMYLTGTGTEKNRDAALYWLKQSGNEKAKWKLAQEERTGKSLSKDYVPKDIIKKNTEPLKKLSKEEYYFEGNKCFEAGNFAKATSYYEEGAKSGDRNALYQLGYCYEMGQGVPQNLGMALLYYEKAAAKGLNVAIEARNRLQAKNVEAAPEFENEKFDRLIESNNTKPNISISTFIQQVQSRVFAKAYPLNRVKISSFRVSGNTLILKLHFDLTTEELRDLFGGEKEYLENEEYLRYKNEQLEQNPEFQKYGTEVKNYVRNWAKDFDERSRSLLTEDFVADSKKILKNNFADIANEIFSYANVINQAVSGEVVSMDQHSKGVTDLSFTYD